MSVKSAYLSSTPSTYSLPPSYLSTVSADITGIASGDNGTLTYSGVPAGRYIVSYSLYATGALDLYNASITTTADNADLTLVEMSSGVLTAYRASGSVIVQCDGVNDVEITLTCDTSAGTWTFKEGSYMEIVSVC